MSENDPELEARWRAASREQPPPALDDAIRAAARREVGARPGGFSTASRWVPVAAAATVAAIAVGIVQMTPPEQVTPAPITATTKSTTDAATDAKLRDAKPDADRANADRPQREAQVAAAAPEAPAAPPAPQAAAKPIAKEKGQGADESDRGVLARNRSDNFAAAPRDQLQEQKRLASRQAAPERAEEAAEREQGFKQKTEVAASTSAVRPNPAASPPPSPPSSMARNDVQPFPAAPAPAPAKSSAENAPPAMAAAEPASAPAAAPAVAAHKFEAQSSPTGALAGHIAGGGVGNAEPAPAQDAAALEKKSAVMADKATAERSKDLTPLPPDEWIKRIRRLIAEGKNEDATRELAAFRREYKERSDALLPADLRAFRR
jgi:hypothetical protein